MMLPEIKAQGLYQYLSVHNIMVVKIIGQIVKLQDIRGGIDYLSDKRETVYSALKWIVETGYAEDELNNEYETILDVAVSVLINVYKDKNILPIVAGMIFERNKKGRYIHDLVWAFFRIREPDALKLIAERIRSEDQENAGLACNLLGIQELEINSLPGDNQKLYESYLKWLKENDPFLYFTGESFQYSSNPVVCSVDLERKYMAKGIPTYDRTPIVPSDTFESNCLEAFRPLSNKEKTMLSDYSYQVHSTDRSKWKTWMISPVNEQIKSVINMSGGLE